MLIVLLLFSALPDICNIAGKIRKQCMQLLLNDKAFLIQQYHKCSESYLWL